MSGPAQSEIGDGKEGQNAWRRRLYSPVMPGSKVLGMREFVFECGLDALLLRYQDLGYHVIVRECVFKHGYFAWVEGGMAATDVCFGQQVLFAQVQIQFCRVSWSPFLSPRSHPK